MTERSLNKLCGRPPQYAPALCDLDVWPFDLENGVRVTCDVSTSLPILVFLDLSVFDLGPMYATDRQTDVRQHHRLMPPPRGAGHNNAVCESKRKQERSDLYQRDAA